MQIRRFESRDDVKGIIRVHGLAWCAAYDGLIPDEALPERPVSPSQQEVKQWVDKLDKNENGVLVAVDDKKIVRGFADFRWGEVDTKEFVGRNEAGLKAIYVEPAYWQQGIGTTLLERGLEIIPDSIDTVRLEVFAENEGARQFYETRGFEQTDTGEYEIAGESYPTSIYTLRR